MSLFEFILIETFQQSFHHLSISWLYCYSSNSLTCRLSPTTHECVNISTCDMHASTRAIQGAQDLPSTTSMCRNIHSKEFARNYSSHLSRTWLLPVTYSDDGACDAHEIWHVRNNWNQAKACRAIARRRSSGHGGADIFRAAVRLRPQEGRLEGNKPFKPRGR